MAAPVTDADYGILPYVGVQKRGVVMADLARSYGTRVLAVDRPDAIFLAWRVVIALS